MRHNVRPQMLWFSVTQDLPSMSFVVFLWLFTEAFSNAETLDQIDRYKPLPRQICTDYMVNVVPVSKR